uniref:Ribonuclease H-like domain-containing protein n=1 Tax=Tanacetum cinerariifolium TaxID=118510 RepID=A0A6L2L4S2_TANCI|nr:ribonuclease H-like domain-containing protein [Tanacetum cinerariifolium]
MCDKKNNVLFTESECLVLSPDFKLIDESQVLVRVPRQNNMYNFDLNNVVPYGDLTCLFAKATIDESNMWHRRLGHVNFKTMNKLVKGNLVRGLPSKTFENDHNYVACQKEKQHKASCKARLVSCISQPLQMLHMDLFGQTFVRSINHKTYCLVVTDDISRVFNTQTKNVEENLHVNFFENKPNVAGQGPNWLFDIDSLAYSMNYQPVTTRNQANKNAGHQEVNGDTCFKKNVDVGHTKQEKVFTQQYIVFPLWSSISSSYKSSDDKAGDNTANDAAGKKNVQEPVSEYDQALKNILERMMKQDNEDIEQSDDVRKEFQEQFNTTSASRTFIPPHDPLMPELEDTAEIQTTGIFGNAYDEDDLDTNNNSYADESVGATDDFNNMKPSTIFNPIPTTRVHYNHPKAQIIEDPMSAVQIKAMQEELLQFKIQKVWTLVDLLNGKKAIVEKALYGLHQAPRAWYETLSTYLLDNGFHRGHIDKPLFIKRLKGDILLVQVYVDDIIFGFTKKSLCDEFEQIMHNKFQMSSMGELTFFLGLQVQQKEDEIFINQDKYVGEILKKFGFFSIRSASTPMETHKPLTKYKNGKDVDVYLYKSMIESLMYLTSSKPDIMFLVCACSRF